MAKWHWDHKFFSSLILLFGLGVFGISMTLPETHFRLNASSSLPQTLFLATRFPPPFAKGQIVSIDHPTLGLPVGKIVGGMPGDCISISDNVLFLNEKEIGKIQAISKSGKTYSPINEGIIEEGSYFVYTPHPDSFDSRYAEFGLIREEWIAEVLWPIF